MTNQIVPPLFPRGTFGGVPSHFRGWCHTASKGGSSGGYRWVGRQFGKGLLGYEPYDLEPDEWFTLVERMESQYLRDLDAGGESVDNGGLKGWLQRHFPRMMKLVPTARFASFLDGFVESYMEGEMMEDFPADFEPVEVNLDDPCCGEGYVRVYYHRPTFRAVVYQCPAPSCREASRRAVDRYAKKHRLPIVDLGSSLSTSLRFAAKCRGDHAAALENALGKRFSRTSMTADMAARPSGVTRHL